MEIRYTHKQQVKLVTRAEDSKQLIEGLGVVFYNGEPDTEYALWSDTYERIAPGALDRAMADSHDVRGLFNHDPSLVLGRTKSGTMVLRKSEQGIHYSIERANTTTSNDVAVHLERGDVSGSSFAMVPTKVQWHEEERDGRQVDVRTIMDVDLYDMGPVTYPAYAGTDAGLRDNSDTSEVRSEYQAWIDNKKNSPKETEPDQALIEQERQRRNALLKHKYDL